MYPKVVTNPIWSHGRSIVVVVKNQWKHNSEKDTNMKYTVWYQFAGLRLADVFDAMSFNFRLLD